MLRGLLLALSLCITPCLAASGPLHAPGQWPAVKAKQWYANQPWLVGSDYLPADAINQLEMWQPDTFDPTLIDREFGWAEGLGMNTMRVFLHDLLWQQDPAGFRNRIDAFLAIAARHHIRPVLVLFDSCWDPEPRLGAQHPPVKGVHNSGWVQSPGVAMADPSQYPRLEAYVSGVVTAFAADDRILAWDIWNEPDNDGGGNYAAQEPAQKQDLVLTLLPRAFAWARAAHPRQPLTSALWQGDWTSFTTLSPTEKIQIANSDFISFHNYGGPAYFEKRALQLRAFGRPLICTEYMARGQGSTFAAILPIEKKYDIGAINWGFVAGKSQTWYPWDSWQHPYADHEPAVWHHDIFHADGTPYRQDEVSLIRQLTSRQLSSH